ncbi:MAG: D-alanyl-D-alanine carboxypeptidase, partial [Actinomycetota bacterium]|nr:D-alanyl-D-alanine carboxypeptidase [Actinomycetota bacterium]
VRLQGLQAFLCALALVAVGFSAVAEARIRADGGVTPVARAGSSLASERGIGRERLRGVLEREMDSVGGASGAYVYDVDANSNRLLYSDSGATARILASNSKLFATGAYLNRFGADGRLETALFARGKRKGGRERTLRGSLVLVGDGDPALATSRFARARNLPLTNLGPLARAVKEAGIRRVDGNVLADPTIFDRATSVPMPGVTPDPGDLPTLSGLSFNRGTEGGGSAQSPARKAGAELVRALRERGVRVTGGVRVDGAPRSLMERDPLRTVASPTARALIDQTNTPSDNFYAEMLLKRLGAGQAVQGTTARGANRAEAFAREVDSGVSLVNGSGLARSNTASPKNVARYLTHFREDQDLKGAFYDSLAIAGRSGTLSDRMRGTAAEGRCVGKTGTINGVSALSGYCRAGAGTIAFSILMNNVSIDAARRAQDTMAAAIARYR